MIALVFTLDEDKLESILSMDCPVILLQEGVYLAMSGHFCNRDVYVIQRDWIASGLADMSQLPASWCLIDDAQWVQLCADHHPIISIQS